MDWIVPKKAELQVSIWFSHTTPHVLHWTLQAGDKQEYVERIMADIKKFVKNFNPTKMYGDSADDIISAHKIVVFENEDATEEKLSAFIGKLVEKLKKLKNWLIGFSPSLNKLLRMLKSSLVLLLKLVSFGIFISILHAFIHDRFGLLIKIL